MTLRGCRGKADGDRPGAGADGKRRHAALVSARGPLPGGPGFPEVRRGDPDVSGRGSQAVRRDAQARPAVALPVARPGQGLAGGGGRGASGLRRGSANDNLLRPIVFRYYRRLDADPAQVVASFWRGTGGRHRRTSGMRCWPVRLRPSRRPGDSCADTYTRRKRRGAWRLAPASTSLATVQVCREPSLRFDNQIAGTAWIDAVTVQPRQVRPARLFSSPASAPASRSWVTDSGSGIARIGRLVRGSFWNTFERARAIGLPAPSEDA